MNIKYVSETNPSKIEKILDVELKHQLSYILWNELRHPPSVNFSIIYNNTHIYLKYNIAETHMRATVTQTNGNVWQDSCVEFFISIDDKKSYYNFEFNSLGARLAGYGKDRTNRSYLTDAIVETIASTPTITESTPGNHQWSLFAAIPQKIFQQDEPLNEKTCSANFYKCGDALEEPHFLSWSKVDTDNPDFHLPQYFGEIIFS